MKKHRIEIPEGTTSIEVAFEQAAEKQGAVEIPLTQMKHARKATGLDILRQRGTPIEMIGSAIAAGDIDTAKAAFRTSVLEYVYEKIPLMDSCGVTFRNSRNLERVDNSLGLLLDSDGPFATIGLTPEHDTVHHGAGKAHAWLCKVESGEIGQKIDDHIDASILALIETLTGNIIAEISNPISAALAKFGKGMVEVHIIVDLVEFDLEASNQMITAHVNVPMVAFWTARS